ncbi:hypothetical protein K474DRAFT_1711287 [Panus rudis PR-1116 ss-1]|nr:hypothetical protein K474DRAFT_1711287 [Panus rudis PR-1116 ss-1]
MYKTPSRVEKRNTFTRPQRPMRAAQKSTLPALWRVNIRSRPNIENLASALRPFIPLSLPVLGSLFSGDVENKTLQIWSSFPPCSRPPPLFSVITRTPLLNGEFRYFCSAEVSPRTPGRVEEDHVLSTLRALRKVLPPDTTQDPNPPIFIGSVNDIWYPSLKSHTVISHTTKKYIRPPLPIHTQSNWDESPHRDWIITELRDEDIELVLSSSSFLRTPKYIRSRLPFSVCLRQSHSSMPIAWNLLTSDGSTGMLHVEPEYRGRGLSRLVKASMLRKLEQMYCTKDEEKKGQYPYARWESCNILADNRTSINLITSLEGWKEGWWSHWLHMK